MFAVLSGILGRVLSKLRKLALMLGRKRCSDGLPDGCCRDTTPWQALQVWFGYRQLLSTQEVSLTALSYSMRLYTALYN